MEKYEILVLDDDAIVSESLAQMLDETGLYQPTVCLSGHEALAKVESQNFDAYLIDQKMPGMTGVEFARHLVEKVPRPLMYFVTGEDNGVALLEAEKGVHAGGLPIKKYINKPWDRSDFSIGLREDIRESLAVARAQQKQIYFKEMVVKFYRNTRELLSNEDESSDDLENQKAKITHLKVGIETISPPIPPQVLVVDDTPVNRKMLMMMLKKMNLRVDEAEDGLQAVEMAAKNAYQLILMDIQMPRMDGNEAIKIIRQAGLSQKAMIVVVTAGGGNICRKSSIACGADEFMNKPVDRPKLMEIINHCFQDSTHGSGQ